MSKYILCGIALALLLLSGCASNPDVQLVELSQNTVVYDEIIRINNCGGKGDSEQTVSREFATTVEFGAGVSAGYQSIVQGNLSAKYSEYRNTSKSQRLVAPPGTNMEFVLRWYDDVRAGNVQVNGKSGTYEVRIPVSVDQISSRDLGCSGGAQMLPTMQSTTTLPSAQIFPTATPQLEFVYREATGGYVTKKYDVTLGSGEVIVGQGYGFQQQTGGCVAYVIKGPGRFIFSVTDGAWLYYKNVTSSEQIELLLQNQIDSLGQYGCTSATIKIVRLP